MLTDVEPSSPELGAAATAPPDTKDLIRLVVTTVAVLVAAEIVVQLLEPSLQPVLDWPDSSYDAHEARLADRRDIDYLVVGSSSAGAAVRPDELADHQPDTGTGYSYWLAGPAFRSLEAVTTGHLLQETAPETVVIGLTMREFNALPGQDEHYDALLESTAYTRAAGQRSWLDPADELLQDHLALARHRALLRQPDRLWQDLRTPNLEPTEIGADGHLIGPDDQELADEPAEHVRQEQAALADYTVSAADLDALDRLLDDLDDRDISAVVINLPVSDDFIELAPGGRNDYDAYVRAVERVSTANGARWHDLMARGWSDSHFRDVNHLNGRGVSRLLPMVADLL